MKVQLCEDCKYLAFDSSFDGYCGCDHCVHYRSLVIDDKGCHIQDCICKEENIIADDQ